MSPEPNESSIESDSIREIQLRSGKVLPPKMAKNNKEKDRNIITQQDDPIPPPQAPAKEKGKGPQLDVDYNVLAHLRKIPSLLSVYDALMMSSDLRETLVKALLEPESYQAFFATESVKDACYLKEMPCITFSDQDFLLGTSDHNRPLYVTTEVNGYELNRVLIDQGASVNILNHATLQSLSLSHLKLTSDKIMLKGFNDQGQRALGSITLPLRFGDLLTEAKFHVIEADTSYKALLGRPWIHEYGMVPSTLHQCMKYMRNDVEFSILGDIQPFAVHEVSIYDDAEHYMPRKARRPPPAQSPVIPTSIVQGPMQPLAQGPIQPLVQGPSQVEIGVDVSTTDPEESLRFVLRHDVPPSRGRGLRGRGRGRESVRPPRNFNARIPPPSHLYTSPLIVESDSDDEMIDVPRHSVPLPAFSVDHNSYPTFHRSLIPQGGLVVDSDSDDDGDVGRQTTSQQSLSRQMYGMRIEESPPQPSPTPSASVRGALPVDRRSVQELHTLYVPAQSAWHASLFHSVGVPQSTDIQGPVESTVDDEIMPVPRYFSPAVDNFVERGLVPSTWSGRQAQQQARIWRTDFPRTGQGIGYSQEDQSPSASIRVVSHSYPVVSISDDEDLEENEDRVLEAPREFEDGASSAMDELCEINLGTESDPRPIFHSALLSESEAQEYVALISEFKDCFAWNYTEMPGLDPEVAVHKLAISPDAVPVKQSPRRMRLEIEQQVIAETKKLIEAGFVREEKYPTWLANVVPVRKKNGQIRVCIDFRDLNKACPKDDFPLPIPELMVDIASSHSIFSFMDGSSGYNQIKMAPEDEKFTAFRTPIGVFCYKVMPFGLKNAGATYQRAMTVIFDELIHEQVECYVDDLVVKSKVRSDHLRDLRIVFERLRKHDLKMNPLKCAFGVSAGKFLGFIVRYRGIEIDPSMIKAIVDLKPPRSLTQLRSFQGKLAFLRRFISNLAGRCHPFAALAKKDARFHWDKNCQEAFESIKRYLTNPPVLAAPIPGKPLILYTTALDESLGALLAQENEEGKENALYYLSRRLIPAELKYPAMEKQCLALIFAVQKLRHYMLSHKISLISRVNPLQYLMTRPTLSGRLARWSMILLQFDITYVPQRAVKGQALADFLASHPIPADSPLNDDLPDELVMSVEEQESPTWEFYFDGASSIKSLRPHETPVVRVGLGLVFVSPEGHTLRYSYSLSEPRTNNEAEYEALIVGLELAVQMSIVRVKIFGDSQLIINQVAGIFKVLKPELLPYHDRAMELLCLIPEVTLVRVPRSENGRADALAKLAKELADPNGNPVSIVVQYRQALCPADLSSPDQTLTVCAVEEESDWRVPFVEYLKRGKLPDDRSLAAQIRKRALSFSYVNETLYRRSFDQMWLRCLNNEEARKVMGEVHEGLCGAHQSGPKMKVRIKRLGYYWPTMIRDCMEHARKCHQCQIHNTVIHQPPNPLHPTVSSWPFESWGTDVVGPIDPPSSKGHRFILAATDYFSKWAEAIPLKEVKSEDVMRFFRDHVVYRFGVPRRIISDNGPSFRSTKIARFARRHNINWRYSSIYYPRANGLAEAFNKTLVQLIRKILVANKREWHDKLPEALWAYRTTYRTPTQCTPYALAFGVEAVLPLEVELPSLRVAVSHNLSREDNARLRLEELDGLEELRLQAHQNLKLYQARMAQAHDRLVRPRAFQVGELVLVLRRPIISRRRRGGKFEPIWEGPFVVEQVYEGGSYLLVDANGVHPMPVINGQYLRKYYA
ncbi:hypothetical protein KFK09_025020 [Dendrobium nobile]|uniref:Uncharacterized protein n=1 Tax=Dendrobium nobile TaxID=94219 RepID=A0A8T3AFQ0_DENNO|nr:hypothetical protein KFK09_025020 [Dendrobium nobile]